MSTAFGAPALTAILAALLSLAIFASAAMRAGVPPRRGSLPVAHARTHLFVTSAATLQERWGPEANQRAPLSRLAQLPSGAMRSPVRSVLAPPCARP